MSILPILVGLGTPAAASWILDRGADINRRDNEFESTPLAWAARVGRAEMIELLLYRGALPSLPDDEPWSMPAAWARRYGHQHILKLLSGCQAINTARLQNYDMWQMIPGDLSV